MVTPIPEADWWTERDDPRYMEAIVSDADLLLSCVMEDTQARERQRVPAAKSTCATPGCRRTTYSGHRRCVACRASGDGATRRSVAAQRIDREGQASP